MKVIELKCPNCGASVSREKMRCQYCGANLVLAVDGSLAYKAVVNCPKCGFSMPSGAWLCQNCGQAITNDLEGLKRLQRKLRFEQFEKRKALPPKIYAILKSDEYVYSSDTYRDYYSDDSPDRVYVITDKRLIRFEKKQISEILLQDIVSVGELKEKRGFFSSSLEFTVNTVNGDIVFSFSVDAYGSVREQIIQAGHCEHIRDEIVRILQIHNTKLKDPLIQICFAQLGQEFDFEVAEEQIKDLLVKYTKRYPHNPKGVLEVHIIRKMEKGKTREQAIKELKDENQ